MLVVGFDDSTIALAYRLSSFSLNPVGAMRAMLEHITRPRSPLFRNRAPGLRVVVDGYVNQRMTSADAPRQAATPVGRVLSPSDVLRMYLSDSEFLFQH